MPIEIIRATQKDWVAFRAVRLRALADAPIAFASRLEDERDLPGSAWRERLMAPGACTFMAFDQGEAAGLVSAFLLAEADRRAHLVSMWVSPEHRRTGVATALVDAILDWSRHQHVRNVELWVTETNEPARQLYARCGFLETGERQPLPSDQRIDEIQMERAITEK
jgi:ribosomal protein S18 acetylase RimI-like enzyme